MNLPAPQRLWNDDDRHLVASLLLGGASASEVGKAMQVTRNAAIGRIQRDPELKPLMRRAYQPHPVLRLPPPRQTPPRFVAEEEEPPTPATPMPLVDTGSQWCKWPIRRDPEVPGGILCCGAPVVHGSVYCTHHTKLARPRP